MKKGRPKKYRATFFFHLKVPIKQPNSHYTNVESVGEYSGILFSVYDQQMVGRL